MKLFNTLSRKFVQISKKDHINLYTCGPTVYNYAHIGNLRAYIEADFLFRSLRYEGLAPRWVMNITDVDDKTIKGTLEKYGKDSGVKELREFTDLYLDEFEKNLRDANVSMENLRMIRVSDVIPEIQKFIVDLVKQGYGYVADDGIYFSIEKYQKDFGDYGELVGPKFLEGKKVGARVAVDEYEKENLSDFALWKAHKPETDGNIFWKDVVDDSSVHIPNGRPGWHVECSVINHVGFEGETTDIHTGGVDLIFPHHTNEIAQSQALLGKGNFVKHWFHSEHILVDGKKMAKSSNNFYTIDDLQDKVPLAGLALRYLFTQSGYRMQQNFTTESFISAYKALEKLYNTLKAHKVIGENQELQQNFVEQYISSFSKEAIENDLNIAAAVALLWQSQGQQGVNIHTQDEIAKKFDSVLGLGLENIPNIEQNIELPSAVNELLAERLKAREEKSFGRSDELRKQIEDLGYEVMDTDDGQKVKKKI